MKLVLQGPALKAVTAKKIADELAGELIESSQYSTILLSYPLDDDRLQALRSDAAFDINPLPLMSDVCAIKLVVTDMDSTLINIECIDEIADFIGVKSQVAAITDAAMCGDIDFAKSLRKRLALLKGVDVNVLQQVYDRRLRLNPGAELMLACLQQRKIKIALVSGGLTFFTERLKQRLRLDYAMANVLEKSAGCLTGRITGNIRDAQAKADFLLACCSELGISPMQALAIGDGANDLLMMKEAGFSVAYHARPKVQLKAMTAINYCGLDGLLGLLQI